MAKRVEVNTSMLPPEAMSQGGVNESPPVSQRDPDGAEEGDGPKIHPDTGAYLPATYKTRTGALRTDR